MKELDNFEKEAILLQEKKELKAIEIESMNKKAELINSLTYCLEAQCISKAGKEPEFTNVFGGEKHRIISDKIIEIVKSL